MDIFSKLKWILGIFMVFVLIIATNLIDRNNFLRVKDSVATIYEDRLVAKELIYGMLKIMHQKEIAIATVDTTLSGDNNRLPNQDLQDLLSRFERTRLTSEERKVFKRLQSAIVDFTNAENRFYQSQGASKKQVLNLLNEVKKDLDALAAIQIEEGGRQLQISQKAIDSVELFTQIEIYVLIFLAVVVQLIVMYNPNKNSRLS